MLERAASADAPLDRGTIAAEAVAMLDEVGLDGFSLRKLAQRLGVTAPAIYRHFPDKTDLLAEVVAMLFQRSLATVPACDSWQEWMRAFGRAIWDGQERTPCSAMLISQAELDERYFIEKVTVIREALAPWADAPVDLFRLQSAVQALISGWSMFAQTSYAPHIDRALDLRAAAFESLDALIAGYEAGVTAHPSTGSG
ncbi:MAG: hypothetical protein RIS94_1610 [Pseudomonadota bacterium]|jgi:TetR/AcrR family tetracycline transcriptional repressor